MKNKNIIYISGKIGEETLSEATKRKFELAEKTLTALGWIVINPCSDRIHQRTTQLVERSREAWDTATCGEFDAYTAYLTHDIQMLAKCSAIYLLHDWEQSPGAKAEYQFAKACRKQILNTFIKPACK